MGNLRELSREDELERQIGDLQSCIIVLTERNEELHKELEKVAREAIPDFGLADVTKKIDQITDRTNVVVSWPRRDWRMATSLSLSDNVKRGLAGRFAREIEAHILEKL